MRENILPATVMNAFVALRYVPLRYFTVVTKINKKQKAQERVLVLTDLHLYSCVKEDGSIKRCLALSNIEKVLTCRSRCEVALVVKEKGEPYDLLFQTASPSALDELMKHLPPDAEIRDFAMSIMGRHNGAEAQLHLEKPRGYSRDVADAVKWKVSSWTVQSASSGSKREKGASVVATATNAGAPEVTRKLSRFPAAAASADNVGGATVDNGDDDGDGDAFRSQARQSAVASSSQGPLAADGTATTSQASRGRALSIGRRGSDAASVATGKQIPLSPRSVGSELSPWHAQGRRKSGAEDDDDGDDDDDDDDDAGDDEVNEGSMRSATARGDGELVSSQVATTAAAAPTTAQRRESISTTNGPAEEKRSAGNIELKDVEDDQEADENDDDDDDDLDVDFGAVHQAVVRASSSANPTTISPQRSAVVLPSKQDATVSSVANAIVADFREDGAKGGKQSLRSSSGTAAVIPEIVQDDVPFHAPPSTSPAVSATPASRRNLDPQRAVTGEAYSPPWRSPLPVQTATAATPRVTSAGSFGSRLGSEDPTAFSFSSSLVMQSPASVTAFPSNPTMSNYTPTTREQELAALVQQERSRFAAHLLATSELLSVERENAAALRSIIDDLRRQVDRLTLENTILKRPMADL